MFIKDVEVTELAEKYPEMEKLRQITANHGEKSDISELCEVIASLIQRIDGGKVTTTSDTKSGTTKK